MNTIIYILLFVFVVYDIFVFRFQRTTLLISRILANRNDYEIQILLSPTWMGLLGWLNTIFIIGLATLIYLQFNFVLAILFLVIALFGLSLLDSFTPFPSYKLCFEIIKRNLKKELHNKHIDPMELLNKKRLLNEVQRIEKEYQLNSNFENQVYKSLKK